ncbi:alkaline phosphatase D family protein [Amycolatopsis albispora]|uniref:Phosphodiesterase n=1 Tax=Amycolatopsis albispora TaxID=1804986 RepID=A0A344LCZ4_9PSEU|nr:alkaline phosphatase D family protein [Amycolatopsis albispora]AXB45918.1 phosphodiesterase [Amycolatopsis albispora]
MTGLVLGPQLRHVDENSATIWVETDGPCTVSVLGTSVPTFAAGGRHYALVVLSGLEPATSTPYDVRLDGEQVWPPPGYTRPAPRIRTLSEKDGRFRIVFGSCRKPREMPSLGYDALVAYARRMATLDESEWPESLLLLGDQVYADETTREMQAWLASRRDTGKPPGTEVADFEEYARLYQEAWHDDWLRWLLSTVPTSMIFDDHDVRDDWNTSEAWREQMAALDWWPQRIQGALASYWIYQHIGNLSPAELAEDPTFQQVTKSGVDNLPALREFAHEADAEADGKKGARWSYRRDFGPVRLLVIDTRAGRVLHDGHRSMVDEDEFTWIERNADGEYDHLLIGTSLPWLLPRSLAQLQSANEVACRRPGLRGRVAEWVRQTGDLEHWSAFRTSFDRLSGLITRTGRAERGPASISVLSGDVHHAYIAKAGYAPEVPAAINQLTCSPLHNTVPWYMRLVFRIGWWRAAEAVADRLARRAGVPPLPLRWTRTSGPHFGNAIATIDVDGRDAVAFLEQSGEAGLTRLPPVRLTER